jgi:uncharacterized membrane protein
MNNVEFNRGAIRPVECLKQGWELIKDQYWLFLAVAFVGLLIAGTIPFGILLGPMLCGIYICYFRKMKKEPVAFEHLFKGFDFFAQSAITSVLQTLPIVLLWLVVYVPLMVVRVLNTPRNTRRGSPDLSFFFVTFGVEMGVLVLITVLSLVVKMFFTFTYPLIAERNMKATEAIKTSFNAALANLGGLIGLLALQFLLGLAGFFVCFFGVYFVLPIFYASDAIAYRQVFPEDHAPINTPPPPPQSW